MAIDFTFNWIIERTLSKTHKVAIPDFVNQANPSIDVNVWSRKKGRLEIECRLTETERRTLNNYWKQTFEIYDGIYIYEVWMVEVEHEWDPATSKTHIWHSTISFIVISQSSCSCPSGEQVTNGGVETGDLTGWTPSGSPTVISNGAHGGTYYIQFADDADKISQTFDDIHVSCISIFKLYAQGSGCWDPDLKVKVYYSDGSNETITFASIGSGWNECDIKPHLDAGKCVSKIDIWFYDVTGPCYGYADDMTLVGSG